jgi:hypothetical protein
MSAQGALNSIDACKKQAAHNVRAAAVARTSSGTADRTSAELGDAVK